MSTTAANRVTDLAQAELFTTSALHEFVTKVRDLDRDIAYILEFQADTLQATLATLPVVDAKYGSLSSRARARAVAGCIRGAAEATKHAARLTVKAWALFQKYYVPEGKRTGGKKKKFDVDA